MFIVLCKRLLFFNKPHVKRASSNTEQTTSQAFYLLHLNLRLT